MLISPTLNEKIKGAMKARDAVRLSTLKMLSSELHNAEIDNKAPLDEIGELAVIKKEAKKRKDSIEAYRNAGREELASSEEAELLVLQEFLPEEMSREKIEEMVSQVISEVSASGMSDMGKVMSAVMSKVGSDADGSVVSSVVREKLSNL